MLREVRAALAVAQAMQDTAQPAAGTGALIPKPRGTSGRGGFNLANEMKVDTEVCHQIQVSILFCSSVHVLIVGTGFCPLARKHVSP